MGKRALTAETAILLTCSLEATVGISGVESARPAGLRTLYHFEPGSYGDKGAFVPSIACEKEDVDGTRVLHFILVKPQIVHEEEAEAVLAWYN
jgi:hypothetical protein